MTKTKNINKPCEQCPWTIKGQPDITSTMRSANDKGEWFCCHVNMGTCHGAKNTRKKK